MCKISYQDLYCGQDIATALVRYRTVSYSPFQEIFGNPSFQPLTGPREALQLSHTEAEKLIQGTGLKSSHILEWLTS